MKHILIISYETDQALSKKADDYEQLTSNPKS